MSQRWLGRAMHHEPAVSSFFFGRPWAPRNGRRSCRASGRRVCLFWLIVLGFFCSFSSSFSAVSALFSYNRRGASGGGSSLGAGGVCKDVTPSACVLLRWMNSRFLGFERVRNTSADDVFGLVTFGGRGVVTQSAKVLTVFGLWECRPFGVWRASCFLTKKDEREWLSGVRTKMRTARRTVPKPLLTRTVSAGTWLL